MTIRTLIFGALGAIPAYLITTKVTGFGKVTGTDKIILTTSTIGSFCFNAIYDRFYRPKPTVEKLTLVEIPATDPSVPKEDTCVICLSDRKVCAAIPCGHLICCKTVKIY